MKRLLSIISTACIVLSLTACAEEIPMEDYIHSGSEIGLFNSVMETGNGYYYNSTTFNDLAMRFYDKTTGKSIYLCNRPECAHDGDMFCTATSEEISVIYTAMYSDSIYIAGSVYEDEEYKLNLYRASLDGTEFSLVCTYLTVKGMDLSLSLQEPSSMVMHRGKAFIPYTIHGDRNVKGAVIADISSGEVIMLDEYEDSGYSNITAEGDYFYYTITEPSSINNKLYRCDIGSSDTEELAVYESHEQANGFTLDTIRSYTVIDGEIWYSVSNFANTFSAIYIYDPDENTNREFAGKLMYDEGEAPERPSWMPGSTGLGYYMPKLAYDGQYLYVAEQAFSAQSYDEITPTCHIFTLDGEEVGCIRYETEAGIDFSLSFLNNNAYLQTMNGVKFCPISDIIAGNTEWTDLYYFEQEQE